MGIVRLLELGAPVSHANRVGQTPLHIATMWGSIEAARALLAALADVNKANHLRGSTPLHAAALGRGPAEKRAEIVRLIVKAKGVPWPTDRCGWTYDVLAVHSSSSFMKKRMFVFS